MGLDLRDLLRDQLVIHPRIAAQPQIVEATGGARLAAELRLVSEWRREIEASAAARAVAIVRSSPSFQEVVAKGSFRPPGLGDLEAAEWAPPCESGHARWGIDVWYLLTYNGMVGEGRAFLVDGREPVVVRERDFQFRAG